LAAPNNNANDEVFYPGVAITPAKSFLYALSSNAGVVQSFAVSGPGLTLTPLANTPFTPGSSGPMISLVIHPSGHFLYVLHSPATIEEDTVNPETGDLTFASSFTESSLVDLRVAVIDPSGRFLYASDFQGGKIFAFQINQTDGSIAALSGSPFSLPAGNIPSIEAIDSTGRFLYASLVTRGIAAFSIDSTTGSLTDVPGSPFATSGSPGFLSADPVANFIYLCNSDGSIDGFSIDPAVGSLAPVPGSPFATAPTAANVAVDPLGKFVYVSSQARSAVFGFVIDTASGSLTAIPGSPFAAIPQVENLYIVKLP
jgi:6-phosphogluconolactonase (cycloisomerase 2 family)